MDNPVFGSRKGAVYSLSPAMLTFLVAWLWPFHEKPWTSVQQEVLAFLAGLLMLALLLFRPVKIPVSIAGFFLLALVPLLQMQYEVISFAGDAWLTISYLFGFALMLLAGYNWSVHEQCRVVLAECLAVTFVLAATLSAWIALRQYFHLADSIWEIELKGGRPYANLAQPNHLATLLGLGVAGCLYLYERHLLHRVSAGVLAALLVLGIALTQSRTPWVTTLAVIAFWALKVRQSSPRLPLKALCWWALFYFVCVLTLPHVGEWLQVSNISLSQRAVAMERWGLWLQLWSAVWHGPLWGYGWGQTGQAQLSVVLDQPLEMMADYAHNLILDLLLWNGPLLGGGIVLLVGAWLLRLSWHVQKCEGFFALLAAGFILTHSMLEFPFAYAYFLLPLGVLLGIAVAERSDLREWSFPRLFLAALLLGGVGGLCLVVHEYQVVKKDYLAQRMAAAKVIGFERDKSTAGMVFLTQLRELQKFRWTMPCAGMSSSDLQSMEVVTHRYPHLANLYRYSLALTLNGQLERAQKHLKILRALHGEESYRQAVQQIGERAMSSICK